MEVVRTMQLTPNGFHDCVVQIGDSHVVCFGSLCRYYSRYFYQNFDQFMNISESDVSYEGFLLVYSWMLCPDKGDPTLLNLTAVSILHLMKAAHFLGIEEVEYVCENYLLTNAQVMEREAFTIYLAAKKMHWRNVMLLMISRVHKYFLILVASDEFLHLYVDDVCLLLSSDSISVHSELEVFLSAARWLIHDWYRRRCFFIRLMLRVRFGFIAPRHLIAFLYPESPAFHVMVLTPMVRRFLRDAIWRSTIHQSLGGGDNASNIGQLFVGHRQLKMHPHRNWIMEEKVYSRSMYDEFMQMIRERRRRHFRQECSSGRSLEHTQSPDIH